MADDQYSMIWGGAPSSDEKLWATIAHLSVYLSAFIGPIVVLLLFQEKSRYIRYHAVQALVFQGVIVIASILVSIISILTCGAGGILGLPLMLLLLVPLYGAWLSWDGQWKGLPGAASIGRS